MAHTGSTQWISALPKATTKTIDARHASSHQSVSRPKRHPQTLDNAPVQDAYTAPLIAQIMFANTCVSQERSPGTRAAIAPSPAPGSPFHQSG